MYQNVLQYCNIKKNQESWDPLQIVFTVNKTQLHCEYISKIASVWWKLLFCEFWDNKNG